MRYDFNTGRGMLRVNFTCTVHGRCKSAYKASSGFFCTNCVYAQRHFLDQFFLIEWRLKNSIHPRLIAPAIDGKLFFYRDWADWPTVIFDGDGFPSFELYRRPPSTPTSHAGPQCVYQLRERSPYDLVSDRGHTRNECRLGRLGNIPMHPS